MGGCKQGESLALLPMDISVNSHDFFVLLGIDVAYDRSAEDRKLLEIAVAEKRALLTRDRRLLMHSIVQHGYYPRSQMPDEQTLEVIRRFQLSAVRSPPTRVACIAMLPSIQLARAKFSRSSSR